MLVRECQLFDLQELWLTDKAIDVNAQGMCGQLCIQTCAEAQKRVGMILFNIELLRQLTIAMARRGGGFTRIASGTFGRPPPDGPVGPSLGSETCEQTVSDLFALVDGHRSTASRSSPMPTKRTERQSRFTPSAVVQGCTETGLPSNRSISAATSSMRW